MGPAVPAWSLLEAGAPSAPTPPRLTVQVSDGGGGLAANGPWPSVTETLAGVEALRHLDARALEELARHAAVRELCALLSRCAHFCQVRPVTSVKVTSVKVRTSVKFCSRGSSASPPLHGRRP